MPQKRYLISNMHFEYNDSDGPFQYDKIFNCRYYNIFSFKWNPMRDHFLADESFSISTKFQLWQLIV